MQRKVYVACEPCVPSEPLGSVPSFLAAVSGQHLAFLHAPKSTQTESCVLLRTTSPSPMHPATPFPSPHLPARVAVYRAWQLQRA